VKDEANSRVGVDTGGTFTDVVADDGSIVKLPSTPADPAAAVAEGMRRARPAYRTSPEGVTLAHGTTVATNALLERRGGRVALVTSEGQRDVIEIARQARPSLYDLWADRPEPLVSRSLRLEVAGRLDAAGKEATPLGPIPAMPDGVDAVAVCLLHADRNPQHEQAVARALAGGPPVVLSSEVSPEFREYERAVTTVASAYLLRPCHAYLGALAGLAGEVLVMTSAGGLVPLPAAAALPVSLLLSGPAGGVLAACDAGAAAGWPDCVTFDMGGTSTDVCLIQDGRPSPAAQRTVAGLPVRMPALDVHTIGAGGGSVARIDPGRALVVGPDSAGADPGPACYGRGGTRATVTDADLVAGRLPVAALPGLDTLDFSAATAALERAGVVADGVIEVVDAAMVAAVRAVSVARGADPGGLALVAFGGAGPLHACALADALGMPAVVVPPRAGVLSAAGILAAPRQVDLVRSWPEPGDTAGAAAALEGLASEAAQGCGPGSVVETALDCRYAGQSHELTVASVDEFPEAHRLRNGFTMADATVEVIALRASARIPSPVAAAALPAPARSGRHHGPAVIAEEDCTIWVAEGWRAEVHPSGSWLLTRADPC
jgi:N-methylhydantoinase A/oxoprolinase/acetone carboxylase beta subunit